jgi:hypothetical protein
MGPANAACAYSLDQIVSHDWYPKNHQVIADDLEEDA